MWLTQLMVGVGCGGLYGLSVLGFSVMPSVSKTLTNMKQSTVMRAASSHHASLYAPIGLAFVGLSLLDSMNLFSVAPILLGTGILVSSGYYRAKRLEVPLWFAK